MGPWFRRQRGGRTLALDAALAAVCVAVLAWPSLPESVETPQHGFDKALVERGAQLAAIGGCAGCHTVPGAMPYAGGVPIATPFGTIYGTNITPHPEAGIGRWSEAAFVRAMREGVDREGQHLYPVFPYDHFRLVSDEELHALYAYLMTRTPVQSTAPANDLQFPFNIRALLSFWKALYLHRDDFRPDPGESAQWNRGAYLVRSLGHCGACHSPRNAFGAERPREFLAGGKAEGWYAPPLDRSTPSPFPWTVEQLTTYLRQGIADRHAMAGGPMQGVVQDLGRAPPQDIEAIAVYLVSLMGPATSERRTRTAVSEERSERPVNVAATTTPPATADPAQRGAAVYLGACAGCHEHGRGISSDTALQLPLAIAVHEREPSSLIRIIREGIVAPEGERSRWMPAFAGALTDDQITSLVTYLRTLAPDAPPWGDVAAEVRRAARS